MKIRINEDEYSRLKFAEQYLAGLVDNAFVIMYELDKGQIYSGNRSEVPEEILGRKVSSVKADFVPGGKVVWVFTLVN